MSMHNAKTFTLNDNYYLRKCFFKRDQVPTQTVMKKKMSPELANVYFKSMNQKLKIIAGFEPPLRGGGSNWYVPPKELLKGRMVLQPLEKKYITKWNCYGIDEYGMKLCAIYRKRMKQERKEIMYDCDQKSNDEMEIALREYENDLSEAAAKANTEYIRRAFRQFESLYSRSITKFEEILFNASISELKKYRQEVLQKGETRYKILLKRQAGMLYDRYHKKLIKQKQILKNEFIEKLELRRSQFCNKLHALNLEKHIAVEKLRHFLECRTLACQVYITFKERDECSKEMELSKYEHRKQVKALVDEVICKDFRINLAQAQEEKRKATDKQWQKKIGHVVRTLQYFVTYCLKEFPDHAEFFINLEKLMLLQMNAVLEDAIADNIIKKDDNYHTPVAKPRPYYVFRKKGSLTSVQSNLCPKHATSSSSQLPVIVINKRCIYAACDAYEQFTDKFKAYISGECGDDADFIDDHDYTRILPVKYTRREELREVKQQSSLQQVLQQQIGNIRNVPSKCRGCQVAHCFDCFCCLSNYSMVDFDSFLKIETSDKVATASHKQTPTTQSVDIKWGNYIKYVEPKKCDCYKMAKKHLVEHLPVYMRTVPKYETPELPNYETCSALTLKALVKKAGRGSTPVTSTSEETLTKDVSVQYTDLDMEEICNCLTDICLQSLLSKDTTSTDAGRLNYSDVSPSFLSKSTKSFATARAFSLRKIIDQPPELTEIFKRNHPS